MRLLLLFATALVAHGARICLRSDDSLQLASSSSASSWFCNSDSCFVNWQFEFDSTVLAQQPQQRFPIIITVGDNATDLSTLFPQITSVALQCSSSGDIVATTEQGDNNERFRVIWSYNLAGVASCADLFAQIDFTNDYRNYQSLLSFGGSLFFDGVLSTQDTSKSLAALSVECTSISATPTPSRGTSASTSPRSANSATPYPSALPCSGVQCAHDAAYWLAQSNNAAWYVVEEDLICGVSLSDILSDSGSAKDLPINLLELAQSYTLVRLACVSFGCDAPYDLGESNTLTAYRQVQQIFANRLNCAVNTDYTTLRLTLDDYVRRKSGECKTANGETVVSANNLRTQRNAYFIWALVVTIVLGILFIIACLMCIITWPILATYLSSGSGTGGATSGGACSASSISIGGPIDDDDSDDDSDDDRSLVSASRFTTVEHTVSGGSESKKRKSTTKQRKHKHDVSHVTDADMASADMSL